MRKIIVAAVAAATLIGPAAAMASSDPGNGTIQCNNATVDNDGGLQKQLPAVVNSNLNVPSGAICRLYGNEVQGNITVQPGGLLHTFGLHADKQVTVNGGAWINSNHGVEVDGNVQITDPMAGSQNGFGTLNDQTDSNLIKGSFSFTVSSAVDYPMYDSAQLYFGSPTTVDKSFTYSDAGIGFHAHLDGMPKVLGGSSITNAQP